VGSELLDIIGIVNRKDSLMLNLNQWNRPNKSSNTSPRMVPLLFRDGRAFWITITDPFLPAFELRRAENGKNNTAIAAVPTLVEGRAGAETPVALAAGTTTTPPTTTIRTRGTRQSGIVRNGTSQPSAGLRQTQRNATQRNATLDLSCRICVAVYSVRQANYCTVRFFSTDYFFADNSS